MTSHSTPEAAPSASYHSLLADRGFRSFLITQFLGAFNDNIYKMLLAGLALHFGQADRASKLLQASAVFVLPFLLFSSWAGQLADRNPKSSVLRWTKLWEVFAMLLATAALVSGNWNAMLAVLFVLAVQATFFSPAKYGIVPEIVSPLLLSKANGLLELSTFVAIVAGGALGTLSAAVAHSHPAWLGAAMVAIAGAGYITSRGIPATAAMQTETPMRWNPLREVIAGNRLVCADAGLRWSMLGNTYFWFIGGLCQSVLMLYAQQSLGVPEEFAGAVVATLAVGIGAGSILAGRLSGEGIEFGLNGFGALLMGVACLALYPIGMLQPDGAFNLPLLLTLPMLVIIGIGGGCFAIPVNAYLQHHAPIELKGTVQAVNNFWNMIGVIAGSLLLWLLNGKLGWSPKAVLAATGVVTLAIAVLLAQKLPMRHVRFGLMLFMRLIFRVQITGRVPAEGALLLTSNHVSYADAFLVGMVSPRPARFLMWKVLYEHPLLRPVVSMMQAIPLSQDNPREALKSLQVAKQELQDGGVVAIFPEGAISRDGQIAEFQSGYLRLLKGVQAKVVPIRLIGLEGHGFCPPEVRAQGWLSRSLPFRRWPIAIHIGEPIAIAPEPEELRQSILCLGEGLQALEAQKQSAPLTV